jgi:hypothetical protein
MQPQREEAAHLAVRWPLLVPAPALKVGVHGLASVLKNQNFRQQRERRFRNVTNPSNVQYSLCKCERRARIPHVKGMQFEESMGMQFETLH